MDIYVVLVEDRHAEVDAAVFASEQAAVAHAEAAVAGLDVADPEDQQLTLSMTEDGWVRYLPYGNEGDNVRVLRRTLLGGAE